MPDDSELIALYSGQILALAADIPHAEMIDAPMAEVRKRAPLCGSNIGVSLDFDGEKITRFGQDVKACALGQASASILGAHVLGLTESQIIKARDQLLALLKADGPTPDAPFERYEVLRPARGFKNRHASIMLALEATLAAIAEAKKKAQP
ncbi:MAG TPA: iron-sulfur cluster assembly scaffold protein [Rhodobacteraceae bacterium]|nr:iron-sulfur cluster assembly scaffold protein [Paracoccaceae bacterium]